MVGCLSKIDKSGCTAKVMFFGKAACRAGWGGRAVGAGDVFVVESQGFRRDVKIVKPMGGICDVAAILVLVLRIPGGVHDDPAPVHPRFHMGVIGLRCAGIRRVGGKRAAVRTGAQRESGGLHAGNPLRQDQVPEQIGIPFAHGALAGQNVRRIIKRARAAAIGVVVIINVLGTRFRPSKYDVM